MVNASKNDPGIVWRIVTVKVPVLWTQSADETWILNPVNRYVITSDRQAVLEDKVATYSDLSNAAYHRPLSLDKPLDHKKILVERHRERGIGDLLFMTGPLAYINHRSKGTAKVYVYGATDRVIALHGNDHLANSTTYAGPVLYDTFQNYDYHWMSASATEYDEEPDQPNVYDALYIQLGLDPATVPAKFKRPRVQLTPEDGESAMDFFRMVHSELGEDWRAKPYWIVAPTSNSTLRSMPYQMWLQVIDELSKHANVIVAGHIIPGRMPNSGCRFEDFLAALGQLTAINKNVANVMGRTPIRTILGLIGGAEGLVCLDSGLLYMAQGLRVPAVSIWGPHDPKVRIGYDSEYMELAVWNQSACPFSPCYAYRRFPEAKCPGKASQIVCEPLRTTNAAHVMTSIEKVIRKTRAKL